MKLSLTYKFENRAELDKHLAQMDAANGVVPSAPAASRSRAKAKDPLADVAMPAAPTAPGPIPQAPAAPLNPLPPAAPVYQAPAYQAPAQQAPSFDRNIVLANISSTVNDLRVQGASDANITLLFSNIYDKLKIGITKITTLDDVMLSRFNDLFYPEVQLLRQSWAPQAPNANSYI